VGIAVLQKTHVHGGAAAQQCLFAGRRRKNGFAGIEAASRAGPCVRSTRTVVATVFLADGLMAGDGSDAVVAILEYAAIPTTRITLQLVAFFIVAGVAAIRLGSFVTVLLLLAGSFLLLSPRCCRLPASAVVVSDW